MSRRDSWHDDDDDDERTRPDLLRPSLLLRSEESEPEDDDSTVGMLMRQTVNNTNAIKSLQLELRVLTREIHQGTLAAAEDRSSIAAGSAKHASNRLAMLLGGLFSLYEISSPYLREIWRQVVHR